MTKEQTKSCVTRLKAPGKASKRTSSWYCLVKNNNNVMLCWFWEKNSLLVALFHEARGQPQSLLTETGPQSEGAGGFWVVVGLKLQGNYWEFTMRTLLRLYPCMKGSSYFRRDTDELYIHLNATYPSWYTANFKQSLAGWLSQTVWGFQTAVLVFKYFNCLSNFHNQEIFLDIKV